MSRGLTCYIDESGNTKDAFWGIGKKSSFDDQPYFALGLVAIDDDKINDLENHVLAMKERYRVKSVELKGKTLYKNNKLYINSILEYLLNADAIIMWEITDKKYFLISQINNFILNYTLKDKKIKFFLKGFADSLYKIIDDQAYSLFCELCRHRTEENYNYFLQHCEILINNNDLPINTDIHSFYKTHIKEMIEEKSDYNSYMNFLPLADMNKKGYSWSSIPNISALTNLIMRMNYSAKQKKMDEGSIKYIHDEECYLDEIFLKNIQHLYTIQNSRKQNEFFEYKNINSEFSKDINLAFGSSENTIGLQVADIVTSAVINNLFDCINEQEGKNEVDKIAKITLEKMLSSISNNINYVMPDELIKKHEFQLLTSNLKR